MIHWIVKVIDQETTPRHVYVNPVTVPEFDTIQPILVNEDNLVYLQPQIQLPVSSF
jgi:hypothetical protein|uniref:Uncharacterized protein n=1 Tax=viral metagenome TaxID=1070528 RepID=A0A6C0BLD1_9ZZZZ